jgi:flagellar capping protein FliD
LDDPFVNFDSVRLGRTLDFFKTLSSEYQIIICALNNSYDGIANNIVFLGNKAKQSMALQRIQVKDSAKTGPIRKSGTAGVIYLPASCISQKRLLMGNKTISVI